MNFSNEVTEEPLQSGLLFKNRLHDQPISIVKPRHVKEDSNPKMLGMYQIELDSLMLSNITLDKQLHMAGQELSHTLHKHDVACRVIARLKKERDEVISLLVQPEKQLPVESSEEKLPVESTLTNTVQAPESGNGKRASEDESTGPEWKRLRPGFSSDIIDLLSDCNASLSRKRKEHKIRQTAAPRYAKLSTHPLYNPSKPGILSMDIHYSKDLIATGGVDSNAVVFDHSSSKIVSTLSGHHEKVTNVKIVPHIDPFVITGSEDRTVRLWKGHQDGNYACKHVLRNHSGPVEAITIHPSNKYFATVSRDKTWCFYDLATASCVSKITDPSKTSWDYTTAAFHPDGLLLGAGTSKSTVRVWDVKSQTVITKLNRHNGAITSISFSENGYYFATAASGAVKLWDLRKRKCFKSYPSYVPNVPINSVSFDHSGRYLAVADGIIRIYEAANASTERECVKVLPDLSATGKVSSARFGADAKYMAVGSMDHNLRIFSLPVAESPTHPSVKDSSSS